MGGRILALGSVNVDVQAAVHRWPEPGETLPAERYALLPGGKAANVCLIARRLGVHATLLARVGDDPLADIALAPLRNAGIDLSRVRYARNEPVGAALVAVRADGDKAIIYAGNANEAWTEDGAEAVEAAIRKAERGSILVVDLEVSSFVVDRAVETARAHGVRVVLDPSPADRVSRYQLGNAAFVVPNPVEAEHLTGVRVRGVSDAFRAAERLLATGVGHAIVKVGGKGCVVVGPDVREHVWVRPGRVVDQTGAGDAFAGALAVALSEGRGPVEAATWGAAAARWVVGAWGSQNHPDRRQLEALVIETART